MGRATTGLRQTRPRSVGVAGRAARLPGRPGGPLVAAGTLGIRRRHPPHQRRQARQEAGARGLPGRPDQRQLQCRRRHPVSGRAVRAMGISLEPDARVRDLAEATTQFVQRVVLPVEERTGGAAPSEAQRLSLQDQARSWGVFAPHLSEDLGGLGLDMRDRAGVFENAGYSLLGPLALNIAAPDEGNAHLLDRVADADQRERYLVPLAAG